MTESRRHADRGPRWLSAALVASGLVASAVVSTAAILSFVMARVVVTPPRSRPEDVAVLGVDEGDATVTLAPALDAVVPGRYGFWFSGDTGHARLGEIVGRSPRSVTRRVLGVDFGELSLATRGRISGWFYLTPRDLGYPFEDVDIPTSLGPAPAWLVPAEPPTERWVIQVHGRAVSRAETLRAVPVFREAGYNSLLVSYRNDGEAPSSADGRYALGDAEWLDVESAIRFAVDRGAREVVLMGWSMGGATVAQAAMRSDHSDLIRGLVLDSPVVDWAATLRFQARLLRLPGFVGAAAFVILGRSWAGLVTGQHTPIDRERLDLVRNAAHLRLPVLLLHSDDDGYVPSGPSHDLVWARPDIVTMETFSAARHTKLWNYDPERWNRAITTWLGTLGKASSGAE